MKQALEVRASPWDSQRRTASSLSCWVKTLPHRLHASMIKKFFVPHAGQIRYFGRQWSQVGRHPYAIGWPPQSRVGPMPYSVTSNLVLHHGHLVVKLPNSRLVTIFRMGLPQLGHTFGALSLISSMPSTSF